MMLEGTDISCEIVFATRSTMLRIDIRALGGI